jgi:tetratricopeptide (TPR) repeat protein
MATGKIPQPGMSLTTWPEDVDEKSWSRAFMDFTRIATSAGPDDRFGSMAECKLALAALLKRGEKKGAPPPAEPAAPAPVREPESIPAEEAGESRRSFFTGDRLRPAAFILAMGVLLFLVIRFASEKIEVRYQRPGAAQTVENGSDLFDKARRHFENGPGFYEEARLTFEEMIARYPWDVRPYPYLAWIYTFRRMPRSAAAAWEKAVELSPDNPSYRISLGLVYHSLGRTGDARAEWKRAVELDPGSKQAASLLKLSMRGR